MLIELKVQNFAIIENIHIRFRGGLNILSGETGAGKSVLLKSLSFLMGGKVSTESIRTGCTQAVIAGYFDLSKRKDIQAKLKSIGIEVEEQLLIVRRLITLQDKSRIYLNDTLSTLNTLRDVIAPLIEVTGHTAPLIEMTGQHENKNLLSKSYHLDILDYYVGAWDLRSQYETKYALMKHSIAELESLKNSNQALIQRLDYLLFQKNEIEKMNLVEGEELELESKIKQLKYSQKILSVVDSAEDALINDSDSAISRLQMVIKKISEISHLGEKVDSHVNSLSQAKTLIEDSMYELRRFSDSIDSDVQSLESFESRLSDLRKLQKKYGSAVADILTAFVQINAEINAIESSEQKIENLEQKIQELNLELMQTAKELHKKRSGGAKLLSDSVNHELKDLNMKGVTFDIHIELLAELTSTGISVVEFLTQTSAKDPKRPLAKAASGGELSRILLSLKKVVGSNNQPRTYLFDEVDTGVSGETAEKVGKKLKAIADGQQVICVTHLAQVAACGDIHFYIHKSPNKNSVMMEVEELNAKSRVNEIARLISGEKISKTSLAHAEELLRI